MTTAMPIDSFRGESHQSTKQLLSLDNPKVLVAAHRGYWQQAPENSISAIKAAIANGADIVEIDVRSTRDGALVLLHDKTLHRTTTGSGAVAELDFMQVCKARLKPKDGGANSMPLDELLPTLSEALEVARDRVVVNIDVKDVSQTDRVAQAVISAGMASQVFVKATIEHPEHIQQVRSSPFFGKVPFVPMMTAIPDRFVQDLRALECLGCPMYEVAFQNIRHVEEGREELLRQGARLWVNTIEASHSLDFNDAHALRSPDAVWGRLLEAGVAAIQTDKVAELVQYLTKLGKR